MKTSLWFRIVAVCTLLLNSIAFAGQGVDRMLYTVPNSSFIENPSGDSNVVTVNDTSGTISGLQTAINNARSSNPNSIIVIHLLRGATYTVSSAGIVLGSQECLVGSGALVQAASSSVAVPLITITSGSTNVSVAGGTLDGNGASINGITGSSLARVNIDKVIVQNCGLDCILLQGQGNTTFDNELTVTRCEASGSQGHAGISIQNATQAAVLDNDCHNNSVGIYLSAGWSTVANNSCENNTTGIQVSGGDDNVIANNTCDNNGTGIVGGGSKDMIVSNSMGGNSTAGISSSGSGTIYIDNLFTTGNAANFVNGGSGDHVVAYKAALSASGQDYFYPPLIDNQHTTTTIVNGLGRTDVTISSTTIDSVQSQYNSARSSNPNNVIVLHLNGTFTVGATPLTLESDTCVLLNGTIQINSGTTASAAVQSGSSPVHVSISGGTIDGGNLTGNNGVTFSSASMLQLDQITLRNFGPDNPRVGGSDVVHFSGGSAPYIVTRCTINGGAARGIWSQLSGVKALYSDNEMTAVNEDGVDCDSSTSGAVVKFNYCHDLVRYGVFFEQSASHNLALGNICNNDGRDINLYNNSTTPRGPTEYNSVLCNWCLGNNGIRNGSTGASTVVTSHNFLFDNVVTKASISSETVGSENYYSQNYLSGGSLSTASGVQVFFNSTDVDGNVQVLDSNSGLAVAVQNASTSSNAPIVTATPFALGDGTGDDEWHFIPTDSGFYQAVNKNSGLVMAVSGGVTNRGASIVQLPYASGAPFTDEWLIQAVGNGLYNFYNRGSALVLDVTGASTNTGTQLDQWTPNGGANQQFALVQDAVPTSTPDFSVSASPGSQIVAVGGGTNYTVTVNAVNGFSGTVTFTVSGLPTGASGNFNPTSVSGSGSSTFSVATSGSTPANTYTLTITATSGTLVHTTTVTLAVVDFTISATPASQTVAQGSSTNYTVNLGNVNGFTGSVGLTASGLPAGATASFSPASVNPPGSSTLTISTLATTPVGTNTITITGTNGILTHSTTVTLVVVPPPDFSIAATPGSQTVIAGNGATYTATITGLNNFNGSVALTASGLPSGATSAFNPTSVTGSGSSTLTITTSGTTPAGTNTITVKGTSGSLVHSTTVTLVVVPPPDFSIAATPSSQTVTAGGNTTYTATITGLNGFSGSVLPSGATGVFNPTSVSGSGSSTLTVTTSSTTPAGTNTITITGTSGSLVHSTTVTLIVTAVPDFTIAASPGSQTITAGNNTTYTATISALNGFSGSVALTVSGLPSGATGAFNPTSVTGSGSSTLTVTTATNTPAGTNTLTIKGVSGSLTHTTTVSLIVNAPNNFAGVFQLKNKASGLVLNNQGSLTNGSAITQWNSVNSSNLDWTFIATSNGYYQINSLKSGKDAVVQSASTTNGAKIIQWSFGSSGDDQWKPTANGDGTYTFFNLHSGLVLADPGSSTNNTTQMDQETSNGGNNQKWTLLSQ